MCDQYKRKKMKSINQQFKKFRILLFVNISFNYHSKIYSEKSLNNKHIFPFTFHMLLLIALVR